MIHLLTLLTAFFVQASDEIEIYRENNPEGKLLGMEEVVGAASNRLYPSMPGLFWDENGELTNKRTAPAAPNWTLPEGTPPDIVYGSTVSRSEFGGHSRVIPSPDGSLLAVYRNDQSAVSGFPLFELDSTGDKIKEIKYPMAGTPSEKLALCICTPDGEILCELQVDDFDSERYLTNPCWSPDGKYLLVQVLDRAQHRMKLNIYRSSDGSFVRTVLEEQNDIWVEPLDPVYFLKDSYYFVYRTDNRDGYRNLYLCDTLGLITRITPCEADVKYLANDGKYVYYTSAEVSPIENHLFRVRINGKKVSKPQRLTHEQGWHNIDMSPDCTQFIDRYSSFTLPGVLCVKSADGSLIKEVHRAKNPLEDYAQCRVELGTVKSADGKFDNYYRLYYPLNYDPEKEYPLIVYVYGGPHSQMVRDSWLGGVRMWEMLMAQKGYFVYVQDNRGTSNQGAEFEKAINRSCGEVESLDQLAGIEALLQRLPAIDRDRIGVHGWSYGGFMALTLSTLRPDIFKVTVAGGPVIDWNWYEVMYTERYMDTPQDNPEGYASTSLLSKVEQLAGRVLICQGMVDDTVVWQHALSFIQKCIDSQKAVDLFVYPKEAHNMRGTSRVHLHDKITDYFETFLK